MPRLNEILGGPGSGPQGGGGTHDDKAAADKASAKAEEKTIASRSRGRSASAEQHQQAAKAHREAQQAHKEAAAAHEKVGTPQAKANAGVHNYNANQHRIVAINHEKIAKAMAKSMRTSGKKMSDCDEQRDIPGSALQFNVNEFSVGDNGEGAKTAPIRLLARAGKPIEHPYWGKVVHDFAGMDHKNKIPIDYRHDEPIGFVNKFEFASGDLELSGALVPFKDSDKATEIIHKSKAGVPYEASIDFRAPMVLEELPRGRAVEVNGSSVEGPATIIRQWTLRGVAVCPYGADPNTASLLSSAETFTATIYKELEMPEEPKVEAEVAVETPVETPPVETPAEAAQQTNSEGKKYLAAFGPQGAVWFVEGKAFDDCVAAFAKLQSDKIGQLEADKADLEKRLAGAKAAGELQPVGFQSGEKADQKHKGFASKIRFAGQPSE